MIDWTKELWSMTPAIAAIGIASGGLYFFARTIRKTRTRPACSEAGLSYSLSFILTLPFVMLFIGIILEATMLLTTKMGTMYAAFAGCRSAVVWSSANPASLRDMRIKQSATFAMAPFSLLRYSSYRDYWREYFYPDANAVPASETYELLSQKPLKNPPRNHQFTVTSKAGFEDKYRHAGFRMGVLHKDNGHKTTVTIYYRYQFLMPGLSRLLAPDPNFPKDYMISTSVTLPSETPISGTLGIDYQSM